MNKYILNLMIFFLIILTIGCSMPLESSNDSNEKNKNSFGETCVSFNFELSAIIDKSTAHGGNRDINSAYGTLKVIDASLNEEIFTWNAEFDTDIFMLTSLKTIILRPGVYDFILDVTSGSYAYAGSAMQITIVDGENSVDMIVRPVIGEVSAGFDVTQLAALKFNYPGIEFDGINDPWIGYIIDGKTELKVKINKNTGMNENYLQLLPGEYNIKLKLYDSGIQIGKSVYSQQDVDVKLTEIIQMDIVPLYSETVFNLSNEGGKALFTFAIPSEVAEETGGLNNLEAILRIFSTRNGMKEEVMILSYDNNQYKGKVELENFYFDTVTMSVTFMDKVANEVIGSCGAGGIILYKDSQIISFKLDLIRRSFISGNLLAVLGLNIVDKNKEPEEGTEIYIDGKFIGLSGSGIFGTKGYLKTYLKAGENEIKAVKETREGTCIILAKPLGVYNIDIELK